MGAIDIRLTAGEAGAADIRLMGGYKRFVPLIFAKVVLDGEIEAVWSC
ncbi:hypothetical protein [Paenibacillus sp. GCM10012303]